MRQTNSMGAFFKVVLFFVTLESCHPSEQSACCLYTFGHIWGGVVIDPFGLQKILTKGPLGGGLMERLRHPQAFNKACGLVKGVMPRSIVPVNVTESLSCRGLAVFM